MLIAKLYQIELEKREAEISARRGSKSKIGFGGQTVRNYVLHPDQYVKDARTGTKVGNPQPVLDGDLDKFLESFLRWTLTEQAPDPVSSTKDRPAFTSSSSPQRAPYELDRVGSNTILQSVVRQGRVLSAAAQLAGYDADGLGYKSFRPDLVVLPGNAEELAAVIRLAPQLRLPVCMRGAGTSLSGGPWPRREVLLSIRLRCEPSGRSVERDYGVKSNPASL